MFQTPLRLLLTLRPKVPAGVLLATAVSTVVFASTPFLIRGVADEYAVDVASVGLISTAQLLGFSLASFVAGRFLRPRRTVMVASVILGIVANVVSGLVPWFWVLVPIRFVSGISLGLIAWIAWAEVFGDDERTGDIAVIGPIVGMISTPIVATVIDEFGVDAWFIALGALHLAPLAFVHRAKFAGEVRPRGERHRPTRAAAAILLALGTLTLGGSSVFIFLGVIGQDEIGLSALLVAVAFSANSLASVPSARWRGSRRLPGLWMLLTAVCAVAVGTIHHEVVFWIALPMWGFAFWMGIPGAFSLLAERSKYPSERAGDAQAIMAAGRVVGPLVGGAAWALDPHLLGVIGGGIMVVASAAMLYVEWRIHPEALGDLVSAGSTS